MKKLFLVLFVIVLSIASVFAQTHDVKVAFITESGYSNNLFIDNLTVGNQWTNDVGVVSINNIPADTSYAQSGDDVVVAPSVTVINLGRNVAGPFNVTMTVEPGGYSSTKEVSSVNSFEPAEVVFDDLTIVPGTPYDINVTSALAGDQNTDNDSFDQYTLIFTGVPRANVLLQQWTSSTCSPCASNNPTIDAFVNTNFSSIVPIKYHVGWPGAGDDPMYLYNPVESYDYRYYYGVNGVPNVIMGGLIDPGFPYTTPGVLQNTYDARMAVGTPVEVTATETKIAVDTVQVDVTINILQPLKVGDYVLQVQAVERRVDYDTAPGSNGETEFWDVFRKAAPTTAGTEIPTEVGTHNLTVKMAVDTAVWDTSRIYHAVYVQDNASHDVLGSAKTREISIEGKHSVIVNNIIEKQELIDDIFLNNPRVLRNTDGSKAGYNLELFEGAFPPAGWTLINPDGGLTLEPLEGFNGPSIGGNNCIYINFYSYSSVGQTDTLYSKVFSGIDGNDTLTFDWAHAEYPNYGPDKMKVMVSLDGGVTYPYTIFDREGSELATVPENSGNWAPGAGDWESFEYALNEIITSIEDQNTVTGKFALAQNYPNPFNPITNIAFNLTKSSQVSLVVYNILGEKVKTLINQKMAAGPQSITWDATNDHGAKVSSGIYFYKLKSAEGQLQKKMLLIK